MSDVTHVPHRSRFEVREGGHTAVLTYELDDLDDASTTGSATPTVSLLHTVVPEELGGRGIGGELADAGVRWARSEGYQVNAVCAFVRGWLDKHPEALG
jgi:hypothetical protein